MTHLSLRSSGMKSYSNSRLKMSSGNQQPFIDSQAYNKASSTYVSFPSKADAMIASLQLSYDVPCRTMDLILSTISHPDFDPKQVKLRSSIDVIDVLEEIRMKDRVAIVHKRPLDRDGRIEQAGFPLFVLEEVLEIIHSRRMAKIKSTFEDLHFMQLVYEYNRYSEEERSLRNMCLVHRSWTTPSQKTLGRILFINEPAYGSRLLYAPSNAWKSIFGPWTTVVAFQMYCRLDDQGEYYEYYFLDDFEEDYREWFENVHRILVSFTNLKSIWMQSYASFFTKWANYTIGKMVLRNTHLRDITLHAPDYAAPFILDSLAETSGNLKHLKTLDLEGARFSDTTQGKPLRGTDFMSLTSLIIKCVFSSHETELETLRRLSTLSKPYLESLHIVCSHLRDPDFEETTTRLFHPSQCTVVFNQLRSLHIKGDNGAGQWTKWIGPHCSSLKDITLDVDMASIADTVSSIPVTIRSLNLRVMNATWSKVEEVAVWTKCILGIISDVLFSELKSFSLVVWTRSFDNFYYKSDKQEAQNRRNRIREFEELMKSLCRNAGIKCSIDLELQYPSLCV